MGHDEHPELLEILADGRLEVHVGHREGLPPARCRLGDGNLAVLKIAGGLILLLHHCQDRIDADGGGERVLRQPAKVVIDVDADGALLAATSEADHHRDAVVVDRVEGEPRRHGLAAAHLRAPGALNDSGLREPLRLATGARPVGYGGDRAEGSEHDQ
jgi:hypothetical protein